MTRVEIDGMALAAYLLAGFLTSQRADEVEIIDQILLALERREALAGADKDVSAAARTLLQGRLARRSDQGARPAQ
ncbi:MAG: hypothetical protein ACREFO_00990 [Acetobacteraceae bacterium]